MHQTNIMENLLNIELMKNVVTYIQIVQKMVNIINLY